MRRNLVYGHLEDFLMKKIFLHTFLGAILALVMHYASPVTHSASPVQPNVGSPLYGGRSQ